MMSLPQLATAEQLRDDARKLARRVQRTALSLSRKPASAQPSVSWIQAMTSPISTFRDRREDLHAGLSEELSKAGHGGAAGSRPSHRAYEDPYPPWRSRNSSTDPNSFLMV